MYSLNRMHFCCLLRFRRYVFVHVIFLELLNTLLVFQGWKQRKHFYCSCFRMFTVTTSIDSIYSQCMLLGTPVVNPGKRREHLLKPRLQLHCDYQPSTNIVTKVPFRRGLRFKFRFNNILCSNINKTQVGEVTTLTQGGSMIPP